MATFSELISLFAELSGRDDLVDESGQTKLKFLFNAGLRYLDVRYKPPKGEAWYRKDIVAGDYKLAVPSCRSILEVWASNADGRKLLEKVADGDLKTDYASFPADIDRGEPSYYAPIVIGLAPSQQDLNETPGDPNVYTTQFSYDPYEIMFGSHYGYSGILLMPPADETYSIAVKGNFFSKQFSAGTDTNYWATIYPEVVVYAAAYALEIFYRNLEGARTQEQFIKNTLDGMEMDKIEEEINTIGRMIG